MTRPPPPSLGPPGDRLYAYGSCRNPKCGIAMFGHSPQRIVLCYDCRVRPPPKYRPPRSTGLRTGRRGKNQRRSRAKK